MSIIGMALGGLIVVICCLIFGGYLGVIDLKKHPDKVERVHQQTKYIKPMQKNKRKYRRLK